MEDFGQRVDLTARIREVLANYPEGTSILKELCQNADDAKATRIAFVNDRRSFPTDDLLGPGLAGFQGPALLAFNDGVFSERDFESISRVGDSKKRTVAGKTGRFGVGFNAVYHVTDLPSFVSDKWLVMFDPSCKHVPAITAANPGKRLDFTRHAVPRGAAAPFDGAFGADLSGGAPYRGTLFRLPLRTPAQAAESGISRQAYDSGKVASMLAALRDEAPLVLLFLKSVRRVDVLEWREGDAAPAPLFSCEAAPPALAAAPAAGGGAAAAAAAAAAGPGPAGAPAGAEGAEWRRLVAERALFLRAAEAPAEEEVASTYAVALIAKDHAAGGAAVARRFLVSQARGAGEAAALAEELSHTFQTHLTPWAAVAAELPPGDGGSDSALTDHISGAAGAAAGRAFCFLPLPVSTGLPVAVNGYFELSSNRRDVWHGEDMAGAGAARARWNGALLRLVAAPAYAALLAAAARELGPGAAYGALWPAGDPPAPWGALAAEAARLAAPRPLAWSRAAGAGRWVAPAACVFPSAAQLELQRAGRSPETEAGIGAAGAHPLFEALLALGVQLPDLPAGAIEYLRRHMGAVPETATPALARRYAAAHPERCSALDRATQVAPLLRFAISDLDLATPDGVAQLFGARLLPLADGATMAAAAQAPAGEAAAGAGSRIYVVSDDLELALVGSQGRLLLDHSLVGPEATAQLALAASQRCSSLRPLDPQALADDFLPALMPTGWRGRGGARYAVAGSDDSEAPLVTWEWLQALWQWLSSPPRRAGWPALAHAGWPLLPAAGGALAPLAPDAARCAAVVPGADWPGGLAEILRKLGVYVIDTSSFELPVDALVAAGYARPPSGAGVAAALRAALGGGGARLDVGAAEELAAGERRLLRSYLLQPIWFESRGGGAASGAGSGVGVDAAALVEVVRQLPLFELANDGSFGAATADGEGGDGGGESPAEAAAAIFVPLQDGCALAPEGVLWAALDERFINPCGAAQAAVLSSRLAVPAPSAPDVYRSCVLPRLPALAPALRDAAAAALLRALAALEAADPSFARELRQCPCVPNGAGALLPPASLHDPRVPELLALLDPEAAFPSPEIALDVAALSALQRLGLRSAADLEALVGAARYVEATSDKPGGAGEALARSRALLAYLDAEAPRLVGQLSASQLAVTAAAAAAAAAAEAREGREAAAGGGGAAQDGLPPRGPGAAGAAAAAPPKKRRGLFASMQKLLSLPGSQPDSPERRSGRGARGAPPARTPSRGGSSAGAGSEAGSEAQDDEAEAQASGFAASKEASEDDTRLWGELTRIRWCLVLQEPPAPGLPWPQPAATAAAVAGSPPPLAAPVACRPAADAWLASASCGLVDGAPRSAALLAKLGWSRPLPGALLGAQLAALGEMHSAPVCADTARVLAEQVPRLYRALTAAGPDEVAAAAAVVAGRPCVWVGALFVPADRVAFKGSLDLSPHLYVTPGELAPFRDLLSALGVPAAFSAPQYAAVLSMLADGASGRPLPPHELSQALAVAAALADLLGASGGGATQGGGGGGAAAAAAAAAVRERLVLPDARGALRPAAELSYNDAPWLDDAPGGPAVDIAELHPRISAPVADALGVASRRRLLLAASADSLALGLAGAGGGVEAFGQSEALTTRLRHIIADYPEGPSVCLELVQNADDAGASVVKFCLDLTQHGTNSTLSPRMAGWQGPALLAYNDAVFSPGDFAAIARIGQDGKMGQPAAIGRFGVGFNAVYHLTDLPSFVSGNHLVLFDPHAKHLPGASASQPGLRISLANARVLRQFPDAVAPYRRFGCTMEGPFEGTLFRLPLRTPAAAAASDIKPAPCSPDEAWALLGALARELPGALLFLKSVRSVEISVILPEGGGAAAGEVGSEAAGGGAVDNVTGAAAGGAGGGAPRLILRASAASPQPLQAPIVEFVSGGGGGTGQQQLAAFFARLGAARPGGLPAAAGRMRLSREWGDAGLKSRALRAAPAGGGGGSGRESGASGSVTLLDAGPDEEEYLVLNALGGGAARAAALAAWSESQRKFVPWVGVAAPLTLDHQLGAGEVARAAGAGGAAGAAAGRAFCFLPLPVSTGLPVAVNGYFELSSNRRDVWHGEDMAGAGAARARWNGALLRDAVAPAYLQLLLAASRELGPSPAFFALFPPAGAPEPWAAVPRALYGLMAGAPLLWCPAPAPKGAWLTPADALLPDAPARGCGRLRRLMLAAGVPLAEGLGREARECLLRWTPGAREVTPAAVRARLRALGDALLPELPYDSSAPDDTSADDTSAAFDAPAQAAGGARDGAAAVADTEGRAAPEEQGAARARQEGWTGQRRPPPAAMLLDYCLSDLQLLGPEEEPLPGDSAVVAAAGAAPPNERGFVTAASTLRGGAARADADARGIAERAARELAGLPLLALEDGSLRTLQPAAAPAPSRDGRGAPSATAATAAAAAAKAAVFVAADEEERALLAALRHRLLAAPAPGAPSARLLALAGLGATNVRRVDADALGAALLPELLPPAWRGRNRVGAEEVAAAAASFPGGEAAWADWLPRLWRWLARRPRAELASAAAGALGGWPLLPLAGGGLAAPVAPARALRGGQGWHEHLSSALARMGCPLLDEAALAAAGAGVAASPAAELFSQPGTAAGVLDAIGAAARAAAAGEGDGSNAGAAGAGTPAPAPQAWRARLAGLTAAERRQLRSFLLQARWFSPDAAGGSAASTGSSGPASAGSSSSSSGALSADQAAVLRKLPIYEAYPHLPHERAAAAPAAMGGATGAAAGAQQQRQPEPADGAAPGQGGSVGDANGAAGAGPQAAGVGEAAGGAAAAAAGAGGGAPPAGVARFMSLVAAVQQGCALPPPGAPAELLGSRFLRAEGGGEEGVLETHLGVPRLRLSAFLKDHVAPFAGELDAAALADAVAGALRGARQLAGADPQLLEVLSTAALVPTRAGAPRPPGQLFDPGSGDLLALFDAGRFPASPFDSGPLLAALAPLGLRRGVDLQVLFEAAEALASAGKAAPGAAPRAHALLRRLDAWAERSKSRHVSEAEERLWAALQSVAWCPVLTAPPEPGLPWPHQAPAAAAESEGSSAGAGGEPAAAPGDALALAPPRMARPASDAWLASAPLRLVSGHAGAPLRRMLGWAAPLPAPAAIAQLVELARLYPAAAAWPEGAPAAAEKLAAAADGLYSVLGASLGDALQRENVELSMRSAPVVWVGTGFADADAAALAPGDDDDGGGGGAPGLLFVVPQGFAAAHGELLRLAGVGDSWGFEGYALALAALADRHGGAPLPDADLATALHLAERAARRAHPATTSAIAPRSPRAGLIDINNADGRSRPQGPSEAMLPDAAGVMAPAGQLYFNDAAWLGSDGARLAHEGLSHAAAEALGVRSMRHMHETSRHQAAADIPCPSLDAALAAAADAHAARCPALGAAGGLAPGGLAAGGGGAGAVYAFLCGLAEAADVAGARSLEVVLDCRRQSGRALLHSALARYQGPALCAVLDGVTLSPDDLSALVGARPPAAGGAGGGAPGGFRLRGRRAAGAGPGLAAAFGVSDVCQALAGDTCCFFDPSGRILAQSAAELRRPQPRGRRYAHLEGGDAGGGGQSGESGGGAAHASLLARFPTQFGAPWFFQSRYDSSADVPATLLRLPLRLPDGATAPQGAGVAGAGGGARDGAARLRELSVTEADARRALAAFAAGAGRGLLLARCARAVSVGVWERGEGAARQVFACRAALAEGQAARGGGGGGGGGAPVWPGHLVQSLEARPRSGGGGLNPFGFLKVPKLANKVHRAAVAIDVEEALAPAALAALAGGQPLSGEDEAAAAAAAAEGAAPGGGGGAVGAAEGDEGGKPHKAGAAADDTAKAGAGKAPPGAREPLERRRRGWLVACCVEELTGLGGLARQLAGGGGGGSNGPAFGPLGAVAACISGGAGGAAEIVPACGLLAAPLALPPVAPAPPAGAAAGPVAGGSLLGGQGFVVGGDLLLEGRCAGGARARGAAPGGAYRMSRAAPAGRAPRGSGDGRRASGDGRRRSGDVNGAAAEDRDPSASSAPNQPDPQQEAFLSAVVTAWEHLLVTLCAAPGGPPRGLAALLPDLIGARAAGDADAARAFQQMYQLAADQQVWPLHSGRLVHVREGTFLQPPGAAASAAAAGSQISQTPAQAPSAGAPLDLAALGDSAMSAMAAAVSSALDFALPGDARRGVAPQRPPGAQHAQHASPPPPPADLGPSGRAFVERHLPLLDLPWSAKLQLDAAGIAGLRAATPAALRPLLRRLGQQRGGGGGGSTAAAFYRMDVAAAVELLEFCFGDLVAAPDQQQQPRPGDGEQPPPQRHPGRLRDILGLPIPTSAGTIVPIGSSQLLVVPPPLHRAPLLSDDVVGGAGTGRGDAGARWHPLSSGLLPVSALGHEFVHESAVAALEGHLRDPAVRRELRLNYYGLPQAAVHFGALLGPDWGGTGGGGSGGGGGGSTRVTARAWAGGAAGGPREAWLRGAWRLAAAAASSAPAWGAPEGAADWGALGGLMLVPLAGGRLMRASLMEATLVPDGGEDGGGAGGAPGGAAGGEGGGGSSGGGAAGAWAALPAPWGWLTAMLQAGGLPVLDPSFLPEVAPLTGPRPRVGRPPFLGPLVRKLRAARAAGMLRPEAWGEEDRLRLFRLLSDHPPRDLGPDDVAALRALPIYQRLAPAAGAVAGAAGAGEQGGAAESGGGGAEAGADSGNGGSDDTGGGGELVALGERDDWLLVPEACLDQLGAVAALLPPDAYRRLLRHERTSGELYHILGLEPASAARLAAQLLLPRLPQLPPAGAERLLRFVAGEWEAMKARDPGHHAEVAALLAATPFVPARGGGGGGVFRPCDLYDPDQPLFSEVMLPLLALQAETQQQGQGQQQVQQQGQQQQQQGQQQALFPAPPFDSPTWLAVLRECGLVHRVDTAAYLRLATQFSDAAAAIAAAAAEAAADDANSAEGVAGAAGGDGACIHLSPLPEAQRQRLAACGGALQRHLASQHHSLLGGGATAQQRAALARLAFAPATLGLPGHPSARRVLACHASAALAADWALCWAALPLLDAPHPLPAAAASSLGLRSPPPLPVVLQHMRRVAAACDADALLSSWPATPGMASPEEATGQLLDHLDRQGLSREQAAAAAAAAFVPVASASRLVPPGRVFLRLPLRGGGGGVGGGAGLAPHAYELPAALQARPRVELLRALGLRDEPSARDLVEAMWAFSQQLAGRRLNPNELAATIRALAVLATSSDPADLQYLQAARRAHAVAANAAAGGAGAGAQGAQAQARPLLAPSAAARLVPASSLAAVSGGGGARLLGRVDPRAAALAHPALPARVARWLGVLALTDAVEEALVEEEGPPVRIESIDGFGREVLQALLCSSEFAAAAYTIVAAHAGPGAAGGAAGGGGGDGGGELRDAARAGPRALAARLRRVGGRIALVRELRTRLLLRRPSSPPSAAAGGAAALDVTLPGRERVYEFSQLGGDLFVAQPPPGLPLPHLLAAVLSRELGASAPLPLAPLIAAGAGPGGGGPGALPGLAPLLLLAGHDAAYEAAAAAGVPGAPLAPGDAALLALQPLRRYAAGEVVAYRARAAPADAAAAAAEARAAGGGGTASGGAGGALCYARVAADAALPPGPAAALAAVQLELAPGEFGQLLASQVFCFKSGADGAGGAAPEGGAAAEPAPAAGAGAPAAGGGEGQGGGAEGGAESGGGAGAVGPAQLVGAVRNMLAAAGMPLDLEREALLQKALAAEKAASDAAAALVAARRAAEDGQRRAEELQAAWQCRVCFSAECNAAFVGCGHTFCSGCLANLTRCPVCRKASNRIRLYK